jgi:hypothetical protein
MENKKNLSYLGSVINSRREKMGKKYLETKGNSLESSILGLWQEAAGTKKDEELSKKQKKLDVDGDGEIEGSDLAKLRKKGAKKEESDLDEGKMAQMHQMMKDKKSPEEIAKMMKLDVKTVKALMAGYMSSSKMMASYESYEIGTPEYREHTQEVTPGQEITDFQRFKVESMKEALAKVWGLDESKKEEKSLTKKVKGGKTMTGDNADEIDLKPEIKEK